MKCPYCGVHYMDDERECPVCGKRAGMLSPKKQTKFTNNPMYPSGSGKASRTRKNPAAKELPTRPLHTHDTSGSYSARPVPPPRRQKTQPKANRSGCLVFFIIVFILFVANIVFSSLLNNDVFSEVTDAFNTITNEDDYSYDNSESIYSEAALSDILPTGTWISASGLTFTIYDNETMNWNDATLGVITSDYISVQALELTEENASTYCTDEELEKYPLTEYTQYTLYAYDWDSDADSLELCLYLPDSVPTSERTSFDCYNYSTGEYETFTYSTDDPYETPITDAETTYSAQTA